MAENEAARRTAEPVVVSNSPDVCLTGGAPVPYSIVAYFPPSIQLAETVLFTEDPAFTIVSSIPGVIGDEAGDGGGVVSGVHAGGAYTHVVTGSHTPNVLAEGNRVVFHTSLMEMNCPSPLGPGNTQGTMLWQAIGHTMYLDEDGNLVGLPDPELVPENERELAALLDDANPDAENPWSLSLKHTGDIRDQPTVWERSRGAPRRATADTALQVSRSDTYYDQSLAHVGDDDNYLSIGRAQATSNVSVSANQDGVTAAAGAEARVTGVEAQTRFGNDTTNATVRGEALTAAAEAKVSVRAGPDGVEARGSAGAEAILARVTAGGQTRIGLQDAFDHSTVGLAMRLFGADTELPFGIGEWGITIEGEAEGLAGAAAAAEGEARANRQGVKAGGRLRLGLGLGLSFKLLVGLDFGGD